MFGKNHTSQGKTGFTIWLRNINNSEIRLFSSNVMDLETNILHEDIDVEDALSTELLEANLKISSLNEIVSLLNKEILNNPIEFETYEYQNKTRTLLEQIKAVLAKYPVINTATIELRFYSNFVSSEIHIKQINSKDVFVRIQNNNVEVLFRQPNQTAINSFLVEENLKLLELECLGKEILPLVPDVCEHYITSYTKTA